MKFPVKPAWRKSRRFFRGCKRLRLGKWDADFPYIGEVDFNRYMLFSTDFLWAVNYDFLNQFIYCGGVKLLQIGIFVGKL